MSIESVIKEKIDEVVNRMKRKCLEEGLLFGEKEELMYRSGITQGICIAGLALLNTPTDIAFNENAVEPDDTNECPICGREMIKDESMVLTSNPPQYVYCCSMCGYKMSRSK